MHMKEEDPVGAYIGGCDPRGNALAITDHYMVDVVMLDIDNF